MSGNVVSPDEIDVARAQEYSLLARLLLRCPEPDFLERLVLLRDDGTELGRAHAAIGRAAAQANVGSLSREHFTLFSGLGRPELLPYASYYLTGFVQGRPLADVRQALTQLGIERSEGYSEPEDHAAILLEVMAGLADGSLVTAPGSDRLFFQHHLEPWIARFFTDLERSASARFYGSVGLLGRTFIEIERRGFELSEPNA